MSRVHRHPSPGPTRARALARGGTHVLAALALPLLALGEACSPPPQSSPPPAHQAPAPPPPVRWEVPPIALAAAVSIGDTGVRFRPGAGWFRAEGRLEWVDGDPESGASLTIEVREAPLPVGVLAAQADEWAAQVHEALQAESAGVAGVEAVERVLLAGAPRIALLATRGQGARAVRSLQVAYDTGAHLVLATWSGPADRFSEQVDAFRASALTFEGP